MHICRLIELVGLPLLLNTGCELELATAPDQVPVSGGAQLALDTRQGTASVQSRSRVGTPASSR